MLINYQQFRKICIIFFHFISSVINDRLALALTGRLGRGMHKGSLQADLTIPVRFDKLFDFATYMLIQYWNGYGESLREYNVRTATVRAGFSLVR